MKETRYNCRTFVNHRNQVIVRVRWNRKKSDYDLPVGRMTYTLLPDESIGHEENRHFDIST